MAMEIGNAYNNYSRSNIKTNEKKEIDNALEKQDSDQKYKSIREYRTYLTDKYDCLRDADYSVNINSSVLSKALSDEKTKEWLEYNLSLMPKVMESTKATVEARGAKIISYNTTIDGYDSMKAELVTQVEADPGTDKIKEDLEERIKKRREEKKEVEKKQEERRAEEAEKEKKAETHSIIAVGSDIKSLTQQITGKMESSSTYPVFSFDAKV